MEPIQVTVSRISDFIDFCKAYRSAVDDSFLYDEDLAGFIPGPDNPSFLIQDRKGSIVAAASLMTHGLFRRARRARFRIFHSVVPIKEYYGALHRAILKDLIGFDSVYLFLNTFSKEIAEIFRTLGYTIEGYSFLLVRREQETPKWQVPAEYSLRSLKPGRDEEDWCFVRNSSFASLRGSSTEITPEDIKKRMDKPGHLDEGMLMLYRGDSPVGVVQCEDDLYEDEPIMNIGPLAVLPEYQGRGLGRLLLRAALSFAAEKGYSQTVLCVNAENENAKSLYEQEKFRQVEAVACLSFSLK